MTELFSADETHSVTTSGGQVIVFSHSQSGVPLPVRAKCARADGILRLAGSTSGVTKTDERKLLSHVRAAFPAGSLHNIVLMSGGTRVLDIHGRTVVTILEAPSLIRAVNPTCRTMGSTPYIIESMSLEGTHPTSVPRSHTSTMELPNPTLDLLWFIQNAAGQTGEWEMDIPLYFALLDHMRGQKAATGLWVWGGGTVTAHEITTALTHRHPCAVVRGSGRLADAVINWVNGNFAAIDVIYGQLIEGILQTGCNLRQVSVITCPQDTRRWLHANGFTK
jgi:hypothetical protein